MSFLSDIREDIESQIADGEFSIPCILYPKLNEQIAIETKCIFLDTHEPVMDSEGVYISSRYSRATVFTATLPIDITQYSKIDIYETDTSTPKKYRIKDVLEVYRYTSVLMLEKL